MEELFMQIHSTLFGNVELLNVLIAMMIIDTITGIAKAIKNKRFLRSSTAYFGYVRKMLTFMIIIAANAIDIIFNLNGLVTRMTVGFYIMTEAISVTENCVDLGLPVPKILMDKLYVFKKLEYIKLREEKNGED